MKDEVKAALERVEGQPPWEKGSGNVMLLLRDRDTLCRAVRELDAEVEAWEEGVRDLRELVFCMERGDDPGWLLREVRKAVDGLLEAEEGK